MKHGIKLALLLLLTPMDPWEYNLGPVYALITRLEPTPTKPGWVIIRPEYRSKTECAVAGTKLVDFYTKQGRTIRFTCKLVNKGIGI